MATCFDVANFFLSKADPEEGELISNLKLQKLVYYAQGFALAILGEPLFSDPMEAWEHGPVAPSLYRAYKEHGKNREPVSAEVARGLADLIDDRFRNKYTLFATQFPVTEWHGRFQDPTLADAVLDRIVHDSYRIELPGDFMRVAV